MLKRQLSRIYSTLIIMTQVKAKLNNLRIAPRKVRAVANLIKGKNVNDALSQLSYFVRKSVEPIKKLLDSAIANAENNLNMVRDNLYVKEFIVNEGTKLKRFRAKGFGRAALIQKKTSHLRLVLDERTPGLRTEKKDRVKSSKASLAEGGKETTEETVRGGNPYDIKKPEVKREIGSKGSRFGSFGKKLFQRKAI